MAKYTIIDHTYHRLNGHDDYETGFVYDSIEEAEKDLEGRYDDCNESELAICELKVCNIYKVTPTKLVKQRRKTFQNYE